CFSQQGQTSLRPRGLSTLCVPAHSAGGHPRAKRLPWPGRRASMSKWLKALGLAAVVMVVAVMVPLYGDPRSSSVEHGEWARMLLRALEMERVVTPASTDAQVFSTLSWKNSLTFRADAYLRGEGVDVVSA